MDNELEYFNLVKDVLSNENLTENRTSEKTLSLFHKTIKLDLRLSFPLLVSKKMNLKNVFEELMWFLRGDTNALTLKNKNVNIWNANANTKNDLNLESMDCGPIYGFQMRHFGADYIDCHTDYTDKGFDQLEYILNSIKEVIKTGIKNRRLHISYWNPKDILNPKTVLPPCHLSHTFYMEKINNQWFIDCLLNQRSADIGLGVPYNMASYALYMHLISDVLNIKPRYLSMVFTDAHIYENHIEGLKTQISRNLEDMTFPTIELINTEDIKKEKNLVKQITKYEFENIKLNNYNPESFIKLKMVV